MPNQIMEADPVIHIVDDDEAIRTALCRLVRSMGWRAEAFATPEGFLNRESKETAGCILLDVQVLPFLRWKPLVPRPLRGARPGPAPCGPSVPKNARRHWKSLG